MKVTSRHSDRGAPPDTARRPKRVRVWVIIASLGFVVVVIAAAVLFFSAPNVDRGRLPRTMWSASSGRPVPDRFTYLAFPRDSEVELVESDGTPTGIKLTRALACGQDELHNDGYVGILEAGRELAVAESQLVFGPSVAEAAALVDNWKKTVATWDRSVTDWPTVDAEWQELPDEAYRVTIRRTDWDGFTDVFVYTVSADDALTPESWSNDQSTAARLGR